MKEICAYQYKMVRKRFGDNNMTNIQREIYQSIKVGNDRHWGEEGRKMVENVDKCVYFGGFFHVSI